MSSFTSSGFRTVKSSHEQEKQIQSTGDSLGKKLLARSSPAATTPAVTLTTFASSNDFSRSVKAHLASSHRKSPPWKNSTPRNHSGAYGIVPPCASKDARVKRMAMPTKAHFTAQDFKRART